ncbi:hypothetical protein HII31_05514 [Pseudocercospora fuligena]|uniref:Uncharacterized protein n=1 Tax=Pseudocercospora fuligena TaxID=685502 RepID=A0A8H6RJV6_9PEZI|nr:hypothetical protein HII31_05514 [Pseudocercospora fuligena]
MSSTTSSIHVPSPGTVDQNGYVHLPFRIADYLDQPGYHPTLVQKLRNKTSKKEDEEPKMVAMSQEDYLRYWAKDDNGKYLPSVEEPPQGRVEWLRYQIRVNDQWREWGQIRTLATSPWSAVYW